MPQITVYVPDDLAEQLDAAENFNVSAICQHALREELTVNATIENTVRQIHELQLEAKKDASTRAGSPAPTSRKEAAAGSTYLTESGNIIQYDGETKYSVVEDLDNLRDQLDDETYIEIADHLGLTPIVDLDVESAYLTANRDLQFSR